VKRTSPKPNASRRCSSPSPESSAHADRSCLLPTSLCPAKASRLEPFHLYHAEGPNLGGYSTTTTFLWLPNSHLPCGCASHDHPISSYHGLDHIIISTCVNARTRLRAFTRRRSVCAFACQYRSSIRNMYIHYTGARKVAGKGLLSLSLRWKMRINLWIGEFELRQRVRAFKL
jgi:hypothetical protein